MLSRCVLVVACIVVAATPARAQQDPEEEREDAERAERSDESAEVAAEPTDTIANREDVILETRWEPRLDARVRAGAGAMGGGDTINPGTGAMSVVDADVRGALRRDRLRFTAPLDLMHRQTFATSLSELRARGVARTEYWFARGWRAAAEVGLGATYKPAWTDPFQPLEEGGFGTTNRYSHWDRRAAADVLMRPLRRHRVRVAYEYVLAVYQHDPMFDAIYDPIHLAPWDRELHRVDIEWRYRKGPVRVRAGAQASRWQYFFMFAGDAKTGVTHAGPGGEPPNPLLELRKLEPRVEAELGVGEDVVVRAGYELELMHDPFKGYLSYVGHHPEVSVRWMLPRDAQLRARVDLFLRRYGRHSYDYDMDPDHPPLAWGDRRAERLGYGSVAASLPLSVHWSAVAEAKLAVRRTNYTYSIDWNYVNWLAWTGAEYRY
jgi:hypothetical protein